MTTSKLVALHGQAVMDSSQPIRISTDEDGSWLRVFIHEDWFSRIKPLYDYAELIDLVDIGEIPELPEYIQTCLDWLSQFTVEFGAYGWTFSISLIMIAIHLVKERIHLGKFTYGEFAWGDGTWEEFPWRASARILEMPVEG